MNSHRFIRALIGALVMVAAIVVISCDERNEADIPPVVYQLKHNIVTPGVAQYVDLRENILGVAASSSGVFVYDISQVGAPVELQNIVPGEPLYVTCTAIDLVNQFVFSASEGSQTGDRFVIYDIDTGVRIGGAGVSGPIVDAEFVSTTERFNLWTVDNSAGDGLSVTPYCYDSDQMRFLFNCPEDRFGYTQSGLRMRGMGRKDSLFALAFDDYRVRLHNSRVSQLPTEIQVPGDPHDCAWYGDYVLVADNLFMTVIHVVDFENPQIVTTFTIPGADRLQKIVIDGHNAILLDDSDGLYIVDVSQPTTPKLLQTISLPEPTCVSAYNGTVAVSDEQLGVLLYTR